MLTKNLQASKRICIVTDVSIMTIKQESSEGKTVYIEKDHVTPGLSPHFTDCFDGPYKLLGYYHGQKDLLKIQDQSVRKCYETSKH